MAQSNLKRSVHFRDHSLAIREPRAASFAVLLMLNLVRSKSFKIQCSTPHKSDKKSIANSSGDG